MMIIQKNRSNTLLSLGTLLLHDLLLPASPTTTVVKTDAEDPLGNNLALAASSPGVEGPTCLSTTDPPNCNYQEEVSDEYEQDDDEEEEEDDEDEDDDDWEDEYTLEDVYSWRADDTAEHDWEKLSPSQRAYLTEEYGFDEHTWGCRADPETLLAWDELPQSRREAWSTKGWNEELWNKDMVDPDPCELPLKHSTPEAFQPVHVDLNVPEVDKFSTEWLLNVEQPVRMLDGYNRQAGDERFTSTMPLGKVVRSALEDNLNFMMFLEQDQYEKFLLNQLIGDHVIAALKEAVQSNKIFEETGNWDPAWNSLPRQDFDWAMIMAPKGSTTPTHYDTDWLNLLYLVEGKKRVVLLPNDERTIGTFETSLNEDGGTAWGHIDMLNQSQPLPEHAREFIVTAGQALVIPRFAWHTVENLEVSLSYNLRIDG